MGIHIYIYILDLSCKRMHGKLRCKFLLCAGCNCSKPHSTASTTANKGKAICAQLPSTSNKSHASSNRCLTSSNKVCY